MTHIVIVDHPLFAEGFACVLQRYNEAQVMTTSTYPETVAPLNALVLVELSLPERCCGLQLIRRLQHIRPDLICIVWTMNPLPVDLWIGLEYKIPGFLDKSMSLPELRYWFNHVMANGAAWPGYLLTQAWCWNDEVAMRLRNLTRDLWLLWSGLLYEKKVADISGEQGWSKRTIERRLSDLYITLGVQSRSEAVSMAWKYHLVSMDQDEISWSNAISEFFCESMLPKRFNQGQEIALNVRSAYERQKLNRVV